MAYSSFCAHNLPEWESHGSTGMLQDTTNGRKWTSFLQRKITEAFLVAFPGFIDSNWYQQSTHHVPSTRAFLLLNISLRESDSPNWLLA